MDYRDDCPPGKPRLPSRQCVPPDAPYLQHTTRGRCANGGTGAGAVLRTGNEGLHQIDLAELLEVKPITLARLLDQLAKAGLVARRADPGDRRAYRIFLTPATAPHLESVEAVAASVRADALRSLNRQEITALFSALRTIRDNLASH